MMNCPESQSDAPAVRFQRAEERFCLKYVVIRALGVVAACVPAACGDFEVAGGVAGRQGPRFMAVPVEPGPAFKLATAGIREACIVGDKRSGCDGVERKAAQQAGYKESFHSAILWLACESPVAVRHGAIFAVYSL